MVWSPARTRIRSHKTSIRHKTLSTEEQFSCYRAKGIAVEFCYFSAALSSLPSTVTNNRNAVLGERLPTSMVRRSPISWRLSKMWDLRQRSKRSSRHPLRSRFLSNLLIGVDRLLWNLPTTMRGNRSGSDEAGAPHWKTHIRSTDDLQISILRLHSSSSTCGQGTTRKHLSI